jgi:hypothetical protein
MAFKGVTKCAVPSCTEPCCCPGNLCEKHSVPGAVVEAEDGTGVVTSWYAERAGKSGFIVIDDLDLGNLFGGVEGVTAELNRNGFTAVRILTTTEEVAVARAKFWEAPGDFSGPWGTQYSWDPDRSRAN